jgi:hypothetical protein
MREEWNEKYFAADLFGNKVSYKLGQYNNETVVCPRLFYEIETQE